MPPTSTELRAVLAPRYDLHEVRARSMATVYRATDTRHRRQVAIKAMHHGDDVVGAKRVANELAWLTAVTHHPFIVPILDGGTAEGWEWFVMPYFEDASLDTIVSRDGPLPVAEALRCTREVADALHHAHSLGLIHRDVKPGNILRASGHAILSDFGVAWWSKPGATLPPEHAATGTMPYMSLSVLEGQPADATSDVFALAATCYELLTATYAFPGQGFHRQLASRVTEAPVPLGSFSSEIPSSLDDLLAAALSPDHAEHFPTALSFGSAIDQVLRTGRSPALASRTAGHAARVFVRGTALAGSSSRSASVSVVVANAMRQALLVDPAIQIVSDERSHAAWRVELSVYDLDSGVGGAVELHDVSRGLVRWATQRALELSVFTPEACDRLGADLASAVLRVVSPGLEIPADEFEVAGRDATPGIQFVDVLARPAQAHARDALDVLHGVLNVAELADLAVAGETDAVRDAWERLADAPEELRGAVHAVRARWSLTAQCDPAGALSAAGNERAALAVAALAESCLGHAVQAIAKVTEALAIGPVDAWQFRMLAQAAMCARAPELVREVATRAAAEGLQDVVCLALVIEASLLSDEFSGSTLSADDALPQAARIPRVWAARVWAASRGVMIPDERPLRDAEGIDAAPAILAQVRLALGDGDDAITLLQRAVRSGAPSSAWMGQDPRWDALQPLETIRALRGVSRTTTL